VNWLSENWKLLFEGVGGTAVVAFIGYVCKRWFESRQRPSSQEATLTAQGARVSDSPVASGFGITQNVNSPTIHVTLPSLLAPAIAAPQPDSARAEREIPRSEIIVTATRVIGVMPKRETWSEAGDQAFDQAIVIQFTNDAGHGYRNEQHLVRASLVYRDSEQNEVLRITGGWIDQATDLANFRVEESHRLIVGIGIREGLFAMEQKRRPAEYGSEYCQATSHSLGVFSQGTVRVRLTDIHANVLLYEGTFDIGTNPLRISHHDPPC
jgi:hypothetical protein